MRIILPSAASVMFGAVIATAAHAAPALPQANLIRGDTVTVVDWSPSTSHWDHHFHSHQDPRRYHEPTEAERRMQRGETQVRNPHWSGYRPYGDRRVGRY